VAEETVVPEEEPKSAKSGAIGRLGKMLLIAVLASRLVPAVVLCRSC
jgi:hypothetical protein